MFEVVLYEKNFEKEEVETNRKEASSREAAFEMALNLSGKFKCFTRIEILEDGSFWKGYGKRGLLIIDLWNEFIANTGDTEVLPEDWFIFKKGTEKDTVRAYFNVIMLP